MTRTTRFCRVVAVALGLSSVPGLAAASQAEVKEDTISILSVKPEGPVPAGIRVTFTFQLEVTLRSTEEADVSIGFNSADSSGSRMGTRKPVKAGVQRLELSAEAVPADTGRLRAFGALIIIAPKPTGTKDSFEPLATAFHPIAVVVDTSAARPITEAEFRTADAAGKRAVLEQIANGRSNLEVDEVIVIVRAAIRDSDPTVRFAALKAVSGRAFASVLAGYRPSKDAEPGARSARREGLPVDWVTDGERLGYMLRDTLLELVHTDPDERVRAEALRAMAASGTPDSAVPFSDEYVALCVQVFRSDRSGHVRAQVVLLFEHGSSDTAVIRSVLKDALVDPDAGVRVAAVRALVPGMRAHARFSYSDVGEILVKQLAHPAAEFRYSAIFSLESLGASAREALPHLDRLATTEPDDHVRRTAVRAAAVIRAAPQ